MSFNIAIYNFNVVTMQAKVCPIIFFIRFLPDIFYNDVYYNKTFYGNVLKICEKKNCYT